MPTPGKRWFHVTVGTYGSWLPGDPRGFRSKGHKIHSSGDHKRSPPAGEHEGLHTYSKKIAHVMVVLPAELREAVGRGFVQVLIGRGHRVLAVSVSGMHLHALAELPGDRPGVKAEIGYAKKGGSRAISKQLPGRVWARDCGLKLIRDEAHHLNTFSYVERHVEEGAFVWTFRNGED
ncbi:MAG: hypothetical protein AAGC44_09070 [Planctomycetota bacterium]